MITVNNTCTNNLALGLFKGYLVQVNKLIDCTCQNCGQVCEIFTVQALKFKIVVGVVGITCKNGLYFDVSTK